MTSPDQLECQCLSGTEPRCVRGCGFGLRPDVICRKCGRKASRNEVIKLLFLALKYPTGRHDNYEDSQ